MFRQMSYLRVVAMASVAFGLLASTTSAQQPAATNFQVPAGTPVCNCAAYTGPHYHLSGNPTTPPPRTRFGMGSGAANRENFNAINPNEQGLPRGRRYYGGRYFGAFSNRFYGPQYGYF
jgi:hypothetical protein